MKCLKSNCQVIFSVLALFMLCTILFSCSKGTKNTHKENDAFEDKSFIYSESKYGRIIKNVNDLNGAQMFFKNCEDGRYLVEIEEIKIYHNPKNGVIQIGQLTGKVVWGEVPWKVISVDRTDQFTELGWELMESFKEFTIEDIGSEAQLNVENMDLGTVIVNEYELLIVRDMEGFESSSNSKISIGESDLDDIECIKYIEWNCVNTACSGTCQDSGGDCNCTGSLGFCNYIFSIRCMKINCVGICERYWPIGGLAWCSCE